MASKIFNIAKQKLVNGGIDLDTDSIRVILVMTNTTADTENDGISFVGDLTTLDEHDGSGYARITLASLAVNLDDANDRAEFDADDITWSALGAGTRDADGMLIIKHVTNDADSIPIAWIEFASDKTPDGSDFTVQWDAEGIIQVS